VDPKATSRVLLVVTALLFSTGGAAIKFAHLSGWQLSSFRSGIAALFLFIALPASRRHWSWRVVLASVCYAATLISYVLANRLTTAANAIYLQSTAPIYVVLLSQPLLRERVTRRDVAFTGVILAGLLLVFSGADTASQSAPNPFRGNLLGAASGVFWALTLISLRFMGRNTSSEAPYATAVLGNVFACLFCMFPALAGPQPQAADWIVVAYLGIFNVGLAYFCLTRGVRHVPAVEASTILLLEPALNPVWTWLLDGERPSRMGLCGGAVIMGATALKVLLDRRSQLASRGDGVSLRRSS
jgi:drug/metabolite transporter, DME family